LTCRQCSDPITPEQFPFGDDVACTHCGTVNTTDWDYTSDGDGMAAWTTGIRALGTCPDCQAARKSCDGFCKTNPVF
jgi:hypothetical protein